MNNTHSVTVTVHHDDALTSLNVMSADSLASALEVAFDAFRGHAHSCRYSLPRTFGRPVRFSVHVTVTRPSGWVTDTFILHGSRYGEVTEYRGVHTTPGTLPHWSVQGTDWAMADAPNLPLTALNDAAAKITDLP